MTIKHTLKLCFLLLLFTCSSSQVSKIEGKRINIDETLEPNKEVEDFIKPYREHVNADMDNIISYALDTYSKSDGELNTAIGNLMADAVYDEGNEVFLKKTSEHIDFVLLNHGGIRAIISQGNITTRTAYEVMPFENSVVVVAMKGNKVNEMMDYLAKAKRAHPISKQLQLTLTVDDKIKSATVLGEPIDPKKTYYVATNDYLYNGGDGMTFFQPNEGLTILDYKIRNVLIDNFKKTDTLNPKIDNRFIKLKF
ncbi:5'-nucleotidase C-terminal domain-containing protein [uncultured Winogradskyella sp.]|uniref:5'-nucleotidase C-terminal domain-containing protein n=1 Tax=Winogradskyella sp. 4-2091 TaxID=3381659 RepID=UPI0026111083|nr:5'-nucleotidase [uncultured Winogradskyella sp.]